MELRFDKLVFSNLSFPRKRESRFFVLIIALVLFAVVYSGNCFAGDEEDPDQYDPERLEMIASQFQSLSGSLNGMPEPPKMDEQIQLPIIETSSLPKKKKRSTQ